MPGRCRRLWKAEMDKGNRARYARRVDAWQSARSVCQIEDWLTGTFHYPPEPAGVTLPQPPGRRILTGFRFARSYSMAHHSYGN